MYRPLRLSVLPICLFLLAAGAPADDSGPVPASRTFLYEIRAEAEAGPGPYRLWVPIPPNTAEQTVTEVEIVCDRPVQRNEETQYGNRMLHVESDEPFTLVARWRIERRELVAPTFRGVGSAPIADHEARSLERFLGPDRMAPIQGEATRLSRQVAGGHENRLRRARVIYDYVLASMAYKKDGEGWGQGSLDWACSAKYGNCTDFHALFIAMTRAAGIPARFQIGFSLPAARGEGELKGYHCWAWFYLSEIGWVPVDISEAWKDASLVEYYFGNLTEDRIALTTGRDLALSPRQEGDLLNYFVHPYLEVAGKPATAKWSVRFQDLR